MAVWQEGGRFLDYLQADADVMAALRPAELAALFALDYHHRHVDTIFRRVFGEA